MSGQPLALEYHGKAQAEGHWRRGQVHTHGNTSTAAAAGALLLCPLHVLAESAVEAIIHLY